MSLTLDAIEEKLNYVSKMLTMQQEHIIHLKQDLQKQKEASAATAQAAETAGAAIAGTFDTSPCSCSSHSECVAVATQTPTPGCRFVQPMPNPKFTASEMALLEQATKVATDFKRSQGSLQGEGARETVPPSKAGASLQYQGESKGQISGKQYSENMQKPTAYNIEAGERAAYLRGFEQAKALLLAVKPEPERGPDNFLWVNVYKTANEVYWLEPSHQTKEGCDSTCPNHNRIACVRVWFNEGQFDD